jgi:hypothetical protein
LLNARLCTTARAGDFDRPFLTTDLSKRTCKFLARIITDNLASQFYSILSQYKYEAEIVF